MRCAPGSLLRRAVRMREAADQRPKILPCPPQWGKGPEAQRGGGSNPTHAVCGTRRPAAASHVPGAGAVVATPHTALSCHESRVGRQWINGAYTVPFAGTPYCPEACHQSATKACRNTASSHGSSSHAGAGSAPSEAGVWCANLSANCSGMSASQPESKPWAWAVGVPHRGPP